jgi:hypothetical protein
MSNNKDDLKGLKKLDYTIVEAVGILVVQGGSIIIVGISGLAVLTVIPLLIVTEVMSGDFSKVLQLLLIEVAGIYLARGVMNFLKGIGEVKND